ncbi:oligosaccharide flippase family protein [Chryseobacterium sp. EO14]|uniref:oligosaccharide flippase family protein n=1 Tax=Chryseobacterium sp. EO14 TaxID=2950551 RepID=UPI00210EF107|nr:oligosaccharide flippase family protein [Chryseobacterium sp. EO14]MCQ4142444.1 oligosaccharide flippase family protein [Chryseobacterium sp. EO14]
MKIKDLIYSENLQNSFWNLLEIILTPLLFFVSIPFFVKYLGEEKYGIWMFVNTVIILMQSLDLGLSTSTYKHVSYHATKNDEQNTINTINTNISLSMLIGLVGLLIISILCLGIYFKNYFLNTTESKTTLILGLFLGSFILITKLLEKLIFNIFRAYEDFKVVTKITAFVKLFTTILNLLLAIYTSNLIFILLSILVMQFVSLYLCNRQIKKSIQHYKFHFILKKKFIITEVNYSVFAWLQSLMVIVAYQSDRILISSFLGMAVLSYYSVVSTMFNHIHMAFSALTSWLFPKIVKNSSNKIYVADIYVNTRNISVIITVSLLCLFSFLYEYLFSTWLQADKFLEIKSYIQWFTVFEFFFIYTINSYYFLNASGNERLALKITGMFTSINFSGMLISFIIYKTALSLVIGLAFSSILAMLFLHIAINHLIKKRNPIGDSLLLLVPSCLGSLVVISENWLIKVLFLFLCGISMYLIFFIYSKTSLNKILR